LGTAADDVVAVGAADGGAWAAEAGGVAALVLVASADILALEELGDVVDGCGLVVRGGELIEGRKRRLECSEVVGRGESQRRKEKRHESGPHGGDVSQRRLDNVDEECGCAKGMLSWYRAVGTVKVWGKQSPATTRWSTDGIERV
jgi:hypothetical protein